MRQTKVKILIFFKSSSSSLLIKPKSRKVNIVQSSSYHTPCNAMEGYVRSLWCENTQTKKKNKDELRLIHGLLHCKNGCGSWNRDRNGSSNIYKIAKNAINNIDRPSYLCRETSIQSTSTSAYNQTLRRYEKT